MNKTIFSLVISSLIIGGCSFGEYADKKTTTTATDDNGTKYYKFTKDSVIDKTFYKVSKPDENWSMVEYDFNATHYEANQIKGGTNSLNGTYSITDKGYLKLIGIDVTTYIKAIKEDDEKISLLWTQNIKDLNKTVATKDTYFFKTKTKADKFIK